MQAPFISHGIIEAQELLRKHGVSLERIEMTKSSLEKLAEEVGVVKMLPSDGSTPPQFLGVEIVVHE